MRQLATIRRIEEIKPITGADAIEAARVGGWWVVVKKSEYKVGDLAIYCEIDSFIPTSIAAFLTKPGQYPKVFEGVEGERLRTARLRGQISQGLLLPVQHTAGGLHWITNKHGSMDSVVEGDDVSEALGIVKYEAPIPTNLAGQVRGMFPIWIPKTDEQRIQNLSSELGQWLTQNLTFEKTEKLEGSSMTVYLKDGEFGVCSRNLDLCEAEGNTMWSVARRLDLESKLKELGRNLALQGEICGEGIEQNIYKLRGHQFYIYKVYDIDRCEFLTPIERRQIAKWFDIPHVPVLDTAAKLSVMDDMLDDAEAKSILYDTQREGVVWKCNEIPFSFKCISNLYLVKQK